jgi:hypothetical protein
MSVLFIVKMMFFFGKIKLNFVFYTLFLCSCLFMFYCRESVSYYDVHTFGNEISVKILSVKNDVSVQLIIFPLCFCLCFYICTCS